MNWNELDVLRQVQVQDLDLRGWARALHRAFARALDFLPRRVSAVEVLDLKRG
jgi:hypothetical protein